MVIDRIGVVGAGAWGTALAQLAARGGRQVRLWSRNPAVAETIATRRENSLYLPGIALEPGIAATVDLASLAECDALLIVTPAQHMRSVLAQLPPLRCPLVLCSKGIEASTELLMGEVAAAVHPDAPLAVLSGPTFAHEVAAGLPTAVTLAASDADLRAALAARLNAPAFRIYATDDVVGAEIGGAVKNVLAIACGVVDGAGLGQNARAALIARGFAEMSRFGLARGGRPETLAGLAGLGDLVLSCSSTSSRNYSLGFGMGQGKGAATLLADRRTVAEGAFTAPVLRRLAQAAGVDMPLVDAVCALLDGAPLDSVIESLLSRPVRNGGIS